MTADPIGAKVHYFDQADLAATYPHVAEWCALRAELDPDGRFLNERLTALFL
ncbi:MAG: D-arabinono-1,4-lactone oxidase [Acidimicrobiales bacterium]